MKNINELVEIEQLEAEILKLREVCMTESELKKSSAEIMEYIQRSPINGIERRRLKELLETQLRF